MPSNSKSTKGEVGPAYGNKRKHREMSEKVITTKDHVRSAIDKVPPGGQFSWKTVVPSGGAKFAELLPVVKKTGKANIRYAKKHGAGQRKYTVVPPPAHQAWSTEMLFVKAPKAAKKAASS